MRKVFVLFLIGLIFFLISFFLARKLFPIPQIVLPVELVSLSQQVWNEAFLSLY